MSKYLLIESRDAYESTAVRDHVELALDLAREGSGVSLFLIQNGVLAARSGAKLEELHAALAAGIEVLADEFSLRERGIGHDEVARGVRSAPIGLVVERLAAEWKVLFL